MSEQQLWRKGGEVKSKQPTIGKVKPGIMFFALWNYGKDSEPANRITVTLAKCNGQHSYAPIGVSLGWFLIW